MPGNRPHYGRWPQHDCKRKLTAVCSHQTRIGNLDAHLI
uniref:Mobile element protein n=1 Tax=Escherichia coli TaxID=562 RepID=A0A6H0A309_ECOLX|nr:Mobile element protein [Escherichia coli]